MSRDRFPAGIWPVDFPEANSVLRAPPGLENCYDMHYCRTGAHWIGCWRVGWRERLVILLTGRLYTSILSSRNAPPLSVVARRGDIFVTTPAARLRGWTVGLVLLVAALCYDAWGIVTLWRETAQVRGAAVYLYSEPSPEEIGAVLRALALPPVPTTNDAPAALQQFDQRPGADGQENKEAVRAPSTTLKPSGEEPAASHTNRNSPAGRLNRPWSLLPIRGGSPGRTFIWRSMNRQGLTVEPSR